MEAALPSHPSYAALSAGRVQPASVDFVAPLALFSPLKNHASDADASSVAPIARKSLDDASNAPATSCVSDDDCTSSEICENGYCEPIQSSNSSSSSSVDDAADMGGEAHVERGATSLAMMCE